MQPGGCDRLVTFQRRRPSTASIAEQGEYADVHQAWARYRPMSAREQLQAGQAVDVRVATLTIRDTAGGRTLTNGIVVLIGDMQHHVTSVTPPGRTGWIELTVQSGLPKT
jgi:head-tail adaptor